MIEKNIKKILKNICLSEQDKIKKAMKRINYSPFQIVFIVNKKKQLIGSVTDGDIRRGLIKKFDTETPLKKVMKKKYLFLYSHNDQTYALNYMRRKKIKYLPILDKNKKIQNIYSLYNFSPNSFYKNKNYNVLLQAGGKGTRLRPLTYKIPKPMLQFKKKPIIEHVINNLKKYELRNIYISVLYLKDKIKNYFRTGKNFNVKINYIDEKKPLGTAGSISLMPKSTKDPLIVTNSDVISNINISNVIEFHKKNKSFATMAVRIYESNNPYGVVETKGKNIIAFKEKPIEKSYINAGLYLFNPAVIKMLKKNKKLDIPDLFKILKLKKKKIIIYPITDNWLDLGNKENYDFFNKLRK